MKKMSNLNYIDEINSIKRLDNRFGIVRAAEMSHMPSCDKENFSLADYKVLMCTQNTDIMGKSYTPFITQSAPKLVEEEKRFIEQYRIKLISEPLMAGYYCDVFCNAQEKRNAKYVDKLMGNYLFVVSNLADYCNNDLIWVWKSLIYNSKSYKCCMDDVSKAIALLLESDVPMSCKFGLLINAYNFNFYNANKIYSLASAHSLMNTISDTYHVNTSFFSMLLNCTPKRDKEVVRRINQRLAENEDIIIKQHPLDKALAPDLLKKTEYLEKAGLNNAAEESYKLFVRAKSSKEGYVHVCHNVPIPKELFLPFIEQLKNASNPVKFLAESDDVLPPVEESISLLSEEFTELGISIKTTDINGNPHPNKGQAMSLNYKCFYDLITLFPVMFILREFIYNKAFCEEKLVKYLESTWLSKPRVAVNPTLSRTEETWMDSIHPALHLLCEAVGNEIRGKTGVFNEYMCPIDSLTLKVEGCLRDVCRKIGISTVREDNHYEVTLEEILNRIGKYQTQKGVKLMSSRTINMLKKLLTDDESKGSNLRNDIAHGFTNTSHYTKETALTIIHCILRVSAIEFPDVESQI